MWPQEALKKYFGYDAFRLEQQSVIEHTLSRHDSLVLMPTGGGKSLCFQIPALIFEGVTIVISPLIALMKDQVDALRTNGIRAAFLNSTLTQVQQSKVLENMAQGVYKIVYVAPERLMSRQLSFLHFLKNLPISLFAIDEAHCISHWGHDFRPEYLQLEALKQHFPHVPVLALTATADAVTRQDIIEKLALNAPQTFISSYNRPNIRYIIAPKQKSFAELVRYLKSRPDDSGIVYTLSRKSTESVAERLNAEGFSALAYHAGMDSEMRAKHQDLFIKDEVQIMIATIAFGMGIDKSNVRFVVHLDLPKNIESYYQETGRAGRDGLSSDALLFYSRADVMRWKSMMEEESPEQRAIMFRKLELMATYCESLQCRRQHLLNYFGESAPSYCGNCDICLSTLEQFDGTSIAQKALSAVVRLEQRFGIFTVIEYLRGVKNSKFSTAQMAQKTFGIGRDIDREDWQLYIQSLIGMGYLHLENDPYPILKLTAESRSVLMDGEKVILTKRLKPVVSESRTFVKQNVPLFQELRKLRREMAIKEGVPPYVVLSDAVLQELATYLPHSLDELLHISGFGEVKTRRYGAEFVACIVAFCEENGLTSLIQHKTPTYKPYSKATKSSTPKKPKVDTYQVSLDMFRTGQSIAEIAAERNLKEGTILKHLMDFIPKGLVKADELMSREKIDIIQAAFPPFEHQSLTTFKEHLGEGFSFDEIRIALTDSGDKVFL